MATHAKFAKLANNLCEFSKTNHIFLKNGIWQMSASLASPRKMVWRMLANLAGPRKNAKILASTHTRKIRAPVDIA
jgi:hypothetical protein